MGDNWEGGGEGRYKFNYSPVCLKLYRLFFQDVSLWTKELTKKSQNIISRINIKAIIFLFFTNVLIKNCID